MTWQPDPWSLAKTARPLRHVGGPPWDGGANCTGTFLRGTARLRAYIRRWFPVIYDAGGYSCRPNTATPSETSMHGTGRAIDLMIRRVDGRADPRGNEIADWLLRHAESLGLQLIIWDRKLWNGSRPNAVRDYTGPHPHDEHLHIELNDDGAYERAPFFAQGLDQLSPQQLDRRIGYGAAPGSDLLPALAVGAVVLVGGIYLYNRRRGITLQDYRTRLQRLWAGASPGQPRLA